MFETQTLINTPAINILELFTFEVTKASLLYMLINVVIIKKPCVGKAFEYLNEIKLLCLISKHKLFIKHI